MSYLQQIEQHYDEKTLWELKDNVWKPGIEGYDFNRLWYQIFGIQQVIIKNGGSIVGFKLPLLKG